MIFLIFHVFFLIFHSFLKKQTVHVKFFKSGEQSTQFHSTLLSSGIAVLPTCVSCCSLLLGSVPERSHKPYVTCAEQFHVAAVCSEASSAVGHGPRANRIVCVGGGQKDLVKRLLVAASAAACCLPVFGAEFGGRHGVGLGWVWD